MKKKIITLSLIGILLISLLSGCGKSEDKEAAKSTEPDIMQVRSICKLATVECYYHNVAKSEKPAGTGIWHFGEKDRQFWIEYTGTVKLGIDMSKVQMKVNGKVEMCGMNKGTWIRVKGAVKEDTRREARVAMMEANKNALQSMYTVDDNLMTVFVFESGIATIYSFTEEPKVINL